MIWFKKYEIEDIEPFFKNNMVEHVGIKLNEIGTDHLIASMPVDRRTHQIQGILHGGATAVLAETVGSIAGHLTLDTDRFYCVGIEINVNHIKAKKEGIVYGTATALHLGRRTQVWNIDISDEKGKRVAASRLTLAVIEKE